MLPVLFSIGSINISSYGVFLALGFLFGVFLIWRLARAWDLDEEKTLDLTLLTFIGGLTGARIYFILEHFSIFTVSPLNIILINKTPGFNFWGGILGGWLILFLFARRFRMDFWQLADITIVGLLGGLIVSNLGCFLGGCNIGIPTRAFFGVMMAGNLGKRWPVQLIEAILLTFSLIKLWSQAAHFHQRGKIISLGFISVGMIKLLLEPFKQNHSQGILPLVLVLLGLTILYRVTKQNPITQLKSLGKFLVKFIADSGKRKEAIQNLGKSWYNRKVAFGWKINNLKKLLRRSNVKLS